LSKDDLIGYFRTADKTSDIIGTRQAAVFQAFASLAGFESTGVTARPTGSPKPKEKSQKPVKQKQAPTINMKPPDLIPDKAKTRRDIAMTVRIEINLPAEGTRETYDNIFQSIRANLIDE
jgi:hypothetical protein